MKKHPVMVTTLAFFAWIALTAAMIYAHGDSQHALDTCVETLNHTAEDLRSSEDDAARHKAESYAAWDEYERCEDEIMEELGDEAACPTAYEAFEEELDHCYDYCMRGTLPREVEEQYIKRLAICEAENLGWRHATGYGDPEELSNP